MVQAIKDYERDGAEFNCSNAVANALKSTDFFGELDVSEYGQNFPPILRRALDELEEKLRRGGH